MLPLLIVDAANVVGSVPDGWWRDRAGAARRLRDVLVPVAAGGLVDPPGELAAPLEIVLVVEGAASPIARDAASHAAHDAAPHGAQDAAHDAAPHGAQDAAHDAAPHGEQDAAHDAAPHGAQDAAHDAALDGAQDESTAGVRVVAAPGSGDDLIVELVRAAITERVCAVVTADRGLRARVVALGALVLGPRSLPHLHRRYP